jgi:hypothetical protein
LRDIDPEYYATVVAAKAQADEVAKAEAETARIAAAEAKAAAKAAATLEAAAQAEAKAAAKAARAQAKAEAEAEAKKRAAAEAKAAAKAKAQAEKQAAAEPLLCEDGAMRWIFRMEPADTYYQATYVDDKLEVYPTSRRGALDFIAQHTGGVEPDLIPSWTLEFDPRRFDTLDFDERWINQFDPTPYLQQEYPVAAPCPPTIQRVLQSLCVDEPTYKHFINWLASIFQTRNPARTAWIFRGTSGTGKGVLFSEILVPLFGRPHCRAFTMEKFAETWNDYLLQGLFLVIDEGEIDHRESSNLLAKTKHLITEPVIELRLMHRMPRPVPNFVNLIITTNNRSPLKLDAEDRRWNVAPCQEISLRDSGFDLHQLDRIKDELDAFGAFLAHWVVDADAVRTPMISAARTELVLNTESTIEEFFRAFKEGNLDYFAESLFAEDVSELDPAFTVYEKAVKRWCRDYLNGPVSIDNAELNAAYKFITGQTVKPNKLGKIAAHRWKCARLIKDDDQVYRGWRIDFTSKEPLWITKALSDRKDRKASHLHLVK